MYTQSNYSRMGSGYWMNNSDGSVISDAEYQALAPNMLSSFADVTPTTMTESGMVEQAGSLNWKTPEAGQTARSVVNQILNSFNGNQAGAMLGMLGNAGYFNQFADWPQIADQVGGIAAKLQQTTDASPEGLVKGAIIHAGNVFENYMENPQQLLAAGAFGPAGSSLEADVMGGESASDVWGSPSDSTYRDIGEAGVDVGASQWMHDVGRMIGLSAAAAGASKAVTGAPAGSQTVSGGTANTLPAGNIGELYAQGGNTMTDVPLTGGPSMPPAQGMTAAELTELGLVEVAPGSWVDPSFMTLPTGGVTPTGGADLGNAGTGATSGVGGSGAAGGSSASGITGALASPQVLGALGGAALAAGLGGSGSNAKTVEVEEGIPDWLMPYVKPQLDKYSTELQNYQVDPYGIMPEAMQQFKNTIGGMYLDPSTNKYLEDYFRLGAERIKGSLSPTFGHMQAFGQHSGYNEALSRGLGDYAVGLYGGAYEKERDRQNQMIAASPAFLGQSSQAAFNPYTQYLQSVSGLGKKKEEPYYTNQFGNILGGAMFGSQFGKAFA